MNLICPKRKIDYGKSFMIQVKSAAQISVMRESGRIAGEALYLGGEAVKEGVSTLHIDNVIRHHIEKCGATPSFLGYAGFPGSACISINKQVIHGIPSKDTVLCEGDIVKIDVGAYYRGFHGDTANTFTVGKVSSEASRLIAVTRESFRQGLAMIAVNNRIGDVGHAIETYVKESGFSVVRKYVGHGVGQQLHEPPDVPNFGTPGRGPRIIAGMTFAIEPMVCAGSGMVTELADKWTVITVDGSLSAHYEHTIAVTEDNVIILTDIS
jgi:methionyl aminopeptidase